MAHRLDIDVRFYELDPYNHVNHAVYIQYFETGRIAVLADAAYTLQGMMEDGVLILVTQIATKFLKPAAGGDHLVVETEVLGYTRVMTNWRQRLMRGDEVLVKQKLSAAVTNLDGRPLRFPRDMIEALRPYQVSS